jgi:hypothetical protein
VAVDGASRKPLEGDRLWGRCCNDLEGRVQAAVRHHRHISLVRMRHAWLLEESIAAGTRDAEGTRPVDRVEP